MTPEEQAAQARAQAREQVSRERAAQQTASVQPERSQPAAQPNNAAPFDPRNSLLRVMAQKERERVERLFPEEREGGTGREGSGGTGREGSAGRGGAAQDKPQASQTQTRLGALIAHMAKTGVEKHFAEQEAREGGTGREGGGGTGREGGGEAQLKPQPEKESPRDRLSGIFAALATRGLERYEADEQRTQAKDRERDQQRERDHGLELGI